MNAASLLGRGFGVALATPLRGGAGVDTDALAALVRGVVAGGADFVVALGSTGQAALLDEAERDLVVGTARAHCGAARLLVGTGGCSTAATIACTERAARLGADGALVVVPPYVRPTPAGIVAHFAAIAAAAPTMPLLAYNVPSRTGTNLLPVTMQALWALPTVVALKESSGDLQQIARVGAELPAGKALLAGDDALLLPTIAAGGAGVVSVAGNVAPRAMARLLAAARAGDLATAQRLQRRLGPLFDALAAEPNPIPVQQALSLLGLGDGSVRLPLLPASAATCDRLRAALGAADEVARA
jgi:4-hydroxy-tetrahydrodipicolinate synthase